MKVVKSLLAAAVLGALSSFSATAMAAVNDCLDGNTITCITEEEVNFFGDPGVEYTIENNSGERLFAFGVSNQAYAFDAMASTFNLGWKSMYIGKKSWNFGMVMPFEFWDFSENDREKTPPTKIWLTGTGEYPNEIAPLDPELELLEKEKGQDLEPIDVQVEPEKAYLGSFESLFGTEDEGVAFFWNAYGADNQLVDGVTLDNFFLSAAPNSDFSTFGAQGTVISTSVNSIAAVPEPATYAMLLAGLGLMGFVARKKQA